MRQKFSRWLSFLTVCFMLAVYCTTAQAALQAVGPANPVDLFPTWYQDTTGMAIGQCLDQPVNTGNIPYCTLLAGPNFNPALPIVFPTAAAFNNYPVEVFYWVADSIVTTTGGLNSSLKLRFALEQSWATGVQIPGDQITFLIVNMQKADNLPANATFTVTHPFGSFTFGTDNKGTTLKGPSGQAYRVRDAAIPIPLVFTGLLPAANTHIGPLLRPSLTEGGAPTAPILEPVSGNSYLALPATLNLVTGSPLGALRNNVTIAGTDILGNVYSYTQNRFQVQGKVAPPPGTPIAVTSSTYSNSATGGLVTVFATSLPTAALSVSSGASFGATPMTENPFIPGSYFASIPTLPATALPGVPPLVSVVSGLDALLNPVPPATTHVLVDGVTISTANFNPANGILTVKANSTDTVVPPILTVPGLAVPAPAIDAATNTLNFPVAFPPLTVTVSSSKGGSATATVTIAVLPTVPIAIADSAITTGSAPVTIDVLANDTPFASLNKASVVTGAVVNGTVSAPNAITGAVTFTADAATALAGGVATFTYTVADLSATPQTSLPATVTVTVKPAGFVATPVTLADLATTVGGTATTVGTAVLIPVLANDTVPAPGVINPASVTITGLLPAVGSTVLNTTTGAVTFTPAIGFLSGVASFSYTVATLAPVSVSASALVTINVTPIPVVAPAVAVNDLVAAAVGVQRIIAVLANDTGPINAATVAFTQPIGAAVTAGLVAGTVNFAAAAVGTYTFTYTVNNTAGVPSLPATVTVNVTSAIADAVTILSANFLTVGASWSVQGNTTNVVNPVGKTVTIYNGSSLAAPLGQAPLDAAGRWKFALVKGANPPNPQPDAAHTVSASLPSGASRLAFPVTIK